MTRIYGLRQNLRQKLMNARPGLGALAAVVAAGLLAGAPGKAEAWDCSEIRILKRFLDGCSVDTTLSAGISVRAAKRDSQFISEINGGPLAPRTPEEDPRVVAAPIMVGFGGGLFPSMIIVDSDFPDGQGGVLAPVPDNFDGGINTDDGKLNFDEGDPIGAPFKITSEALLESGRYAAFVRATFFYDAVLNTDSSYERIGLQGGDAEAAVGLDFELLDAFVSADFDIFERPLQIKVGNQLINWGESTFYLFGVSTNTIDIPSFRRPGTEIKEAFLPEWSVSASYDVPVGEWIEENIGQFAVEGYYTFQWRGFDFEAGGSPFSGVDLLVPGNYGNQNYWSSSAVGGTFRRNCSGSPARRVADMLTSSAGRMAVAEGLVPAATPNRADVVAGTAAALETRALPALPGDPADAAAGYVSCADVYAGTNTLAELLANPAEAARDYRTVVRNNGEAVNNRFGNLNQGPQLSELDADDQGQWGIAVRWFAENLNSTEFGFYYKNYHSKIPILEYFPSQVVDPNARATVTVVPTGVSGFNTNALNGIGCVGVNPALDALTGGGYLVTGAFADSELAVLQNTRTARAVRPVSASMIPSPTMDDPDRMIIDPNDPLNMITAEDADGLRLALDPAEFGTTPGALDTVANAEDVMVAGLDEFRRYAEFADAILGVVSAGAGWTHDSIADSVDRNGPNRFDVARINCALISVQSGLSAGNPVAVNGAELLGIQHNTSGRFFYPEDIQLYGFSFATTIGDWGVQGDFTWREDQPLQVNTTEQVIQSAGMQCTGHSLGDTLRIALTPLGTQDQEEVYGTAIGGEGGRLFRAGDALATFAGFPQRSCVAELVAEGRADENGQGAFRPVSHIRQDVFTATLGFTSAIYTASNPFVDFIGADSLVFVGDMQVIYAPDLPPVRTPASGANKYATPLRTCHTGTVLPLGGLLGLDTLLGDRVEACYPDKTSWGYTILASANYSNAFGTAWNLNPVFVLRHDVQGNSPTPLSTFREDRLSATFTLNATYQQNWRASFSYTNFFGREGGLNNTATDLDFAAFSISYAF